MKGPENSKIWIKIFPFSFELELDSYGRVTYLRFDLYLTYDKPQFSGEPETINQANSFVKEFLSYLKGTKNYFEIPHSFKRTSPLSQKVLLTLREIPRGEVRTYGEFAKRVGLVSSPRAVGQILAHNPLPLIYPCHRIISKNHLGGYSAKVLNKWLLLYWEKILKT
ncbi:MAG: MGMT family protein [Caldimicrobium sp.]|nr:MGMT family protein [Caldimicrobium sp.]MCX7874093.1 MGMT family protein [Caldimicrobium sp.]MDW8093772.1 MGMT family protein [Caldimicrobium sp.]